MSLPPGYTPQQAAMMAQRQAQGQQGYSFTPQRPGTASAQQQQQATPQRAAYIPPANAAPANLAMAAKLQQQQQNTYGTKTASGALDQSDIAFRAAKRRKATDGNLPSFLPSELSPATRESDAHLNELAARYAALRKLERKLDWTTSRKKADFAEAVGQQGFFASVAASAGPDRSSVPTGGKLPAVLRVLRIGITHEVQEASPAETNPGQNTAEVEGDEYLENNENKPTISAKSEKTWTLKITGRLLPPEPLPGDSDDRIRKDAELADTRKFGSMIRSMRVEVEPEEGTLNTSETINWQHSADTKDSDGITLTRPLTSSTQSAQPLKIGFLLENYPERYKLSAEVAYRLNCQEETRAGLAYLLWTYIRANKLLEQDGRSAVKLDDFLANLCGTAAGNSFPFWQIHELMLRYLGQPDFLWIGYSIDLNKSGDSAPETVYYDLPISVRDPTSVSMQKILSDLGASKDNNESTSQLVNDLLEADTDIANACAQIRDVKARRDFLAAFAHDPKQFIAQWLQSQSTDLDEIINNHGTAGSLFSTPAEDMRHSQFWRGIDVDTRLFEHSKKKSSR